MEDKGGEGAKAFPPTSSLYLGVISGVDFVLSMVPSPPGRPPPHGPSSTLGIPCTGSHSGSHSGGAALHVFLSVLRVPDPWLWPPQPSRF